MFDGKILGATLLSTEEAETLLTQEERAYKDWWWLRSPGYSQDDAAIVYFIGKVYIYGRSVNYSDGCVRPALNINISSSNIKVGDVFMFGGKEFKVLTPELAWMHKDDIGRCAFRKVCEVANANIYEISDVKRFIDKWFASALGKKLKTVYYGHHQYKYGTPIEAYELKTIQKYFADDITVINPSTDIEQWRPEKEIMSDCLDAVKNCDIFVFSTMDGVIGKGLYTELLEAVKYNKPVYKIMNNTLIHLTPTEHKCFKLELLNTGNDREYAILI